MATIDVPIEEAPRFGIVGVDRENRVTSFVEKPAQPPSTLANMGVYLFNTDVLSAALLEDHDKTNSSHDFGKDILPGLIHAGERVFAYPYTGYWMDVGTALSYWQAHMDQLADTPPFDLNDRSWVIHTRTEERPPVWVARGALLENSMICDGCEIGPQATVLRSILSPGVLVKPGAVIKESIILTDTVIEEGAVIERAILDKKVRIGKDVRLGAITQEGEPVLTMVGKNSTVPSGFIVEPGAVISTDVIEGDYSSNIVHSDDYIMTKRSAHEV
jgi:glucose-1-phosphate adenylyltransferase